MKKILSTLVLLSGMLLMSNIAFAEPLSINEKADIESVLKTQSGKRVTVKLNSGEELTGMVGALGDEIVHLRELSGKEFFDAVVNTDDISALIIRTKDQ